MLIAAIVILILAIPTYPFWSYKYMADGRHLTEVLGGRKTT